MLSYCLWLGFSCTSFVPYIFNPLTEIHLIVPQTTHSPVSSSPLSELYLQITVVPLRHGFTSHGSSHSQSVMVKDGLEFFLITKDWDQSGLQTFG